MPGPGIRPGQYQLDLASCARLERERPLREREGLWKASVGGGWPEGRRRHPKPHKKASCVSGVREDGGHADVRITAGIYARPSKENLRKALERIVGED